MNWPISWNDINEHLNKTQNGSGGGGLPVVEFSTSITEETTEMIAEDSAVLDEMASKEQPFIAKYKIMDGMMSAASIATPISSYNSDGVCLGTAFTTILFIDPSSPLLILWANEGHGWMTVIAG